VQTTPETAALLRELYEQASIVTELDGPQIEAWVSGLFTVFDDQATPVAFVDVCVGEATEQGALLIAAVAELTDGLDPEAAEHAHQQNQPDLLPGWAAGIGTSVLNSAWSVTALFGRSIVLGFENPDAAGEDAEDRDAVDEHAQDRDAADEDGPEDLRHSILVELDGQGRLVDLQLAGPPQSLLNEAAAADTRVVVAELDVSEAVSAVIAAWPEAESSAATFGSGFDSNQQFVRRRIVVATGHALSAVRGFEAQIDVRRGLNDDEYANANRAALSTMQAAVGLPDGITDDAAALELVPAWVSLVHGDISDVSPPERDALLWLEWADWLGAGIGLLRAGPGAEATGETLVDHVNRCPEVSSSIDKADRDYAEWAFDVALDLLQDRGAVNEDHQLTEAGYQSLWHGLVAAWN
jgi:hypothetical protein